MLSPFAPHTARGAVGALGHTGGLSAARVAVVRRRGREGRRDRRAGAGERQAARPHDRPPDTTEDELRETALADPAVQAHIAGKTVKKVIVAQGKLVNVVVG